MIYLLVYNVYNYTRVTITWLDEENAVLQPPLSLPILPSVPNIVKDNLIFHPKKYSFSFLSPVDTIDYLSHFRLVEQTKLDPFGRAFVVGDENFDCSLSFDVSMRQEIKKITHVMRSVSKWM